MQVSFESRRGSTSDRLRPAPELKHPITYHYAIQSHTTRMQKLTKAFQVYRLMALTLICVIAGIVIGLICRARAKSWTERQFMYIELPGELYLRFLKLMIIPLLVSNVILSFGTIQGKVSSRLGKVAGVLYFCSNFIAITIAILVAVIISPGGTKRPIRFNHHDSLHAMNDYNKAANHHYYHEYHDSIARYREYHPMYYHTNLEGYSQRQAEANKFIHFALISRQSNKKTEGDLDGQTNKLMDEDQILHKLPIKIETENRETMIEVDDDNLNLTRIDLDHESVNSVQSNAQQSHHFKDMGSVGLSTKLPIDVVLDVLRNIIPDSLIGATLQQSRTRLFTPRDLKIDNNGTTNPPPHTWQMGHEMANQPNIIGLLAISVLTGVVLSHMGEASKPLLELCSCISELSLRIGMKAIHIAPICIMFLLIGQISRARDLSLIANELFMYVMTVLIALFIHGFIVLPIIYYLITKKSPFTFFKGLIQALIASFATSSSSATMALVLNCMGDLDLNLVIVRAFGPLGSVFNMNGTSMFEAIAVIFIAQTLGVRLPGTSLLLIGLCSAIASLSTSGIPSSGMMTMVIVLNAINLPVLELSLIYIVDFVIDRFRTVVNVWSGAVVCGLIDHICPEELFEEEMGPEKYREMVKYRGSRTSLSDRKNSQIEEKPQVISITITPPPNETSKI